MKLKYTKTEIITGLFIIGMLGYFGYKGYKEHKEKGEPIIIKEATWVEQNCFDCDEIISNGYEVCVGDVSLIGNKQDLDSLILEAKKIKSKKDSLLNYVKSKHGVNFIIK